ncbi:MAG: RNA polymerase sigma factor [Myxococcota bacterium]
MTPAPDLSALVAASLEGDRTAARALFVALGPIFLRAARSTLGPTHPDVDDFVQEAALKFFSSLPAFRGESRVERYAGRIAAHLAADWIRRKRALKRDRVGGEIPEHVPSLDDPTDHVRRHRLGELLHHCLSPAQLDTFLFRNVLGCTLDEVGAMTGVPTNTVRSRLRLAREAIQRELKKNPELIHLLEPHHD